MSAVPLWSGKTGPRGYYRASLSLTGQLGSRRIAPAHILKNTTVRRNWQRCWFLKGIGCEAMVRLCFNKSKCAHMTSITVIKASAIVVHFGPTHSPTAEK